MKKSFFYILAMFICYAGIGQIHGGNGVNPGNGNTLPPQGNKVIVYKDMKYSGMSLPFGEGVFYIQDLGFIGNNISSLYVPQGYTLTVRDSRGNSRIFTSSVSSLAQYGWDNRITSGVIARSAGVITPQPPVPTAAADLYIDAGFRGKIFKFNAGRIRYIGITGDRQISSIRLTKGYIIKVFSGINFTGHFRTFYTSVVNLGPLGWNDMIRSLEIFRL